MKVFLHSFFWRRDSIVTAALSMDDRLNELIVDGKEEEERGAFVHPRYRDVCLRRANYKTLLSLSKEELRRRSRKVFSGRQEVSLPARHPFPSSRKSRHDRGRREGTPFPYFQILRHSRLFPPNLNPQKRKTVYSRERHIRRKKRTKGENGRRGKGEK